MDKGEENMSSTKVKEARLSKHTSFSHFRGMAGGANDLGRN